jgi:hypothetical protein
MGRGKVESVAHSIGQKGLGNCQNHEAPPMAPRQAESPSRQVSKSRQKRTRISRIEGLKRYLLAEEVIARLVRPPTPTLPEGKDVSTLEDDHEN